MASNRFAEELTCSICLDLFRDPVILDCGHDFCRFCIHQVWDSQPDPTCPLCKKKLPEKKVTPNEVLASFVQRVRVDNEFCSQHQERFRLFCMDCGELSCTVCREALAHSGHCFLPVPDAAQMYQEQLSDSLTSVKAQLKAAEELIAKQQRAIRSNQESQLVLERHISEEFEKLQQILRKKEQEMKQKLKNEGTTTRQEMQRNLTAIEEHRRKKEEIVSSTQAKHDQSNHLVFLADIQSFFEMFQTRQKGAGKAQEVLSKQLSLGQFKGPIQYMTWKAMMAALTPGISCLKLDPDASHPVLCLSEAQTCLDYHSNSKSSPSDNPKRFNYKVCTVGSERFHKGRHYWEVEVGDKAEWMLGVCHESSKRKDDFKLAPEDRYWTIGRSKKDRYIALDSPSKVLKVSGKPQRIGVFLDHEGGQLSFYDAKKMDHMYTFHCTFNGAVYAFFSPCGKETTKIRVFHPKV